MAKGIGSALGTVVIAIVALVAFLLIFNKLQDAEIFKAKEDKLKAEKEQEKADRGLFANIFAGLVGEKFAKDLDQALGGNTYGEKTPDDVDKNDFDKNSDKQKEDAKKQQEALDKLAKELDAEKKKQQKQEEDAKKNFHFDYFPYVPPVTNKTGARLSSPKPTINKKGEPALTAVLQTSVGGTRTIVGSPALIARLQKNILGKPQTRQFR